jgi:IS5 family transposase
MKSKTIRRRSPKRPRTKRKRQYRIRNWPEYNGALVARGSLTLWIEEHAIRHWLQPSSSGQAGRPCIYSDTAVQCMALLSCVYHLPLRATQGLLHSILFLMGLNLPTPHYSTLCRRRAKLQVALPTIPKTQSLHLVVDSTGLKLFGEGEWKVRQHGWSRHRGTLWVAWRRLHLGVDEATGEVLAACLTPPQPGDKEMLPDLLKQVSAPLAQVSGDGGYDYVSCYQAIEKAGAWATISPRHNAHIRGNGQVNQRDENLQRIRQLQGRKRKDLNWGEKAVEAGMRLPPPQPGRNLCNADQDDLWGATERAWRAGAESSSTAALPCAQPHDTPGDAAELRHLITLIAHPIVL